MVDLQFRFVRRSIRCKRAEAQSTSACTLATVISNAIFAEITSKAVDSARHFSELHAEISAFLQAHSNVRSLLPS